MNDFRDDPFQNPLLHRLQLFVYLIPVFGLVPAVWTLTRRGSDRQHRQVSRLVVLLGFIWGLGWLMLNTGDRLADGVESPGLQISILGLNSLITSGYFLTLLWLMVRLWKHQPLKVPVVSPLTKLLP